MRKNKALTADKFFFEKQDFWLLVVAKIVINVHIVEFSVGLKPCCSISLSNYLRPNSENKLFL